MVDDQQNDASHGYRGGGPLHVVATHNSHGFMSSDDKTLVDDTLGEGGELDDLQEQVEDIEEDVDGIGTALDEAQSEAQNAANAITTEFRVMNYLLSRILSTLDDKAQVDLEVMRQEASEPVEISVANELLMSILNALSNGQFNIDLDVLRQEN